MIRRLRHRHRWMMGTLFVLLVAAVVAAVARPAPSPRMETLPPALVDAERQAPLR